MKGQFLTICNCPVDLYIAVKYAFLTLMFPLLIFGVLATHFDSCRYSVLIWTIHGISGSKD